MTETNDILPFHELEAGVLGQAFVLLDSKTQAKTRDGKPYYRVVFRDAVRSATAMVWADSRWFDDCHENWTKDGFYKIRGKYTESQYGPQLDIERIRAVESPEDEPGFDPSAFFVTSRFDADEMYANLVDLAQESIEEKPLLDLTLKILETYEETIRTLPAAARNHHAYRGGFVEHVLSVTQTAAYLADKYAVYYKRMKPPLSKSLVVAGAILHDIGKVKELSQTTASADYTAEGRLIGHILLGRDLVRDHAKEIPDLSEESRLRLEHIVVSHQNLPEWGSPIAPHTPEALLVHYADDIDAKFHMMASVLEEPADDDEDFSSYHNPLRRRIYRGTAE